MSISLHPGTNLSRHAGSLLHRIGQLFKFAGYYIISCGDLSFITDESKALTEMQAQATERVDHAEHRVEGKIAKGDLPEIDGIDIAGSHGAITSLFAGTAPDAGNYNGKVCSSVSRTASEM